MSQTFIQKLDVILFTITHLNIFHKLLEHKSLRTPNTRLSQLSNNVLLSPSYNKSM